jgi:hypothetical protein
MVADEAIEPEAVPFKKATIGYCRQQMDG